MIKGQDVVLLLKLIANPDACKWTQKKLAEHLCVSVSTINASLQRLIEVRLIICKKVCRQNAHEFIVGGVKYLFPQEIHGMTGGIPTGYATLMVTSVSVTDPIQVWPYAVDAHRGLESTPLYPSVPESVSKFKDQKFYDLLCLVDVLRSRISNVREKHAATELLKNLIL
jgi:hypothetical protein